MIKYSYSKLVRFMHGLLNYSICNIDLGSLEVKATLEGQIIK